MKFSFLSLRLIVAVVLLPLLLLKAAACGGGGPALSLRLHSITVGQIPSNPRLQKGG